MSSEAVYDRVPYPSAPYWFSHPSNLAVRARLHGLEAAPLRTARVLELGIASGRNLLPMAALLPEATFVGIESSPVQVAAARELAKAAGLDNVELVEGRFEEASIAGDAAELARFDYIVAHGVYSWVDPDTRRAMLRVCRQRLAPGGVVYISYNTLPGWTLPQVARDLLLFYTRDMEHGAEREAAALSFFERVVDVTRDVTGPLSAFYKRELERLRGQHDGYLTHDHLEIDNHPVYFETFMAETEAVGLSYVTSAIRERTDTTVWPPVLHDLMTEEPDRVRRQQLLDFVVNTRFRASVLCARESSGMVRDDPELTVLDELYARSDLSGNAAEVLDPREPGAVVLTTPAQRDVHIASSAVKRALVAMVRAAPQAIAVADLLALGDPESLREALLALYLAEIVELSAFAPSVASGVDEYPRAPALARLEAEGADWVTTQWHRAVTLSKADRALLARLDGQVRVGEADATALERLAKMGLLLG